jgi:glycosyltransferase involved in cell wall biosynthesis
VPHGNFIGFYPDSARRREDLRSALGIDGPQFTYLIFGQLRRYKRIPAAIAAFRRTAGPDARLVVAGAAWDDAVRRDVVAQAAGDRRVILRLEHVPDAAVADLHAAADAAVLPYSEVFSSGALLLALSFGLPVVAPARGSLEIAGRPALEPFSDGNLPRALAAIRDGDQSARRDAALAAARRFSWDAIADRTLSIYAGREP